LVLGTLGGGKEVVQHRGVVEVPSARRWKFGMPLHRGHEAAAGATDRLDQAIRRALGLDDKTGREVLDGLVVDAVDSRPADDRDGSRRAGCPATNSISWKLRS
jgi:hypothetical protein